MRKVTVLITAAGNVFMPGTTACLKNNGEREIRLIGADMNDDPSMLEMVDVYYPVPRGDDPSYVDVLFEICKKEKVDVVLPIMSVELNALAHNKERFQEIGTKISVSDEQGLLVANDKLQLLKFLRTNGIVCAAFQSAKTIDELKAAVESLGYPQNKVCVKATDASGSRGFRILDATSSKFDKFFHDKPTSSEITLEDLVEVLSEKDSFPELLLMEYLPGAEYTIDLLADNGKVLANCCRKSLRMENSIMLDSEVVDKPEIETMCAEVVYRLGLDGNIGFDIKENKDGIPVIMECNPRITAGIPVFYHAGVNLPYLCVKKVLGEVVHEVKPEYGKIVRRRWKEMIG